MIDKDKIMNDLEEKFSEIKKDLGFKASLEEIDKIFFIKDMVMKDGFVSGDFSRRLGNRIIEGYMDWNGYLHSLVMPNPQNMLNIMESKIFNQEEKRDIMEMMKKIMEMSSRHSLISIISNRAEEGRFIDDAVNYWNNKFKTKLGELMKKINSEWGKK